GEAPDVSCDPLAIKQTIANLVSNAIHYNQAGGTVEVLIEHNQDEVSLCVADTGVGISVVDLSQIFERFYRVDKARGIDEGRSGLGLAICKAILDAHGGSLEAQSVLGKGSRFRFRLPR
ncbi:MAG: ATP-binding protein, partial [Verrucomicrobiota bacterium]